MCGKAPAMADLSDLAERVSRLEATVHDLSGLSHDMRAVLQAIGTAPSPATGAEGSGLLKAVADLMQREAERDRAKRDDDLRTAELVAWRGWATAGAAILAAAASVWSVMR